MKDGAKKKIWKAITWKLISTSLAMGVAFLLTGSVQVAVSIAIIHIPASMLLYILHEYLWD